MEFSLVFVDAAEFAMLANVPSRGAADGTNNFGAAVASNEFFVAYSSPVDPNAASKINRGIFVYLSTFKDKDVTTWIPSHSIAPPIGSSLAFGAGLTFGRDSSNVHLLAVGDTNANTGIVYLYSLQKPVNGALVNGSVTLVSSIANPANASLCSCPGNYPCRLKCAFGYMMTMSPNFLYIGAPRQNVCTGDQNSVVEGVLYIYSMAVASDSNININVSLNQTINGQLDHSGSCLSFAGVSQFSYGLAATDTELIVGPTNSSDFNSMGAALMERASLSSPMVLVKVIGNVQQVNVADMQEIFQMRVSFIGGKYAVISYPLVNFNRGRMEVYARANATSGMGAFGSFSFNTIPAKSLKQCGTVVGLFEHTSQFVFLCPSQPTQIHVVALTSGAASDVVELDVPTGIGNLCASCGIVSKHVFFNTIVGDMFGGSLTLGYPHASNASSTTYHPGIGYFGGCTLNCETGSFTSTNLTDSSYWKNASCKLCEPGTSSNSANLLCPRCHIGSATSAHGAASCSSCSDGAYSDQLGATACSSCEAGFYCSSGLRTSCSSPSVSTSSGRSTCGQCGGNSIRSSASSCATCSSGTFADSTHVSCLSCASNAGPTDVCTSSSSSTSGAAVTDGDGTLSEEVASFIASPTGVAVTAVTVGFLFLIFLALAVAAMTLAFACCGCGYLLPSRRGETVTMEQLFDLGWSAEELGFKIEETALYKLAKEDACIIPSHALKFQQRLGQGAFGEVYKATWATTPVAVKRLIDQSLRGEALRSFCDEAYLLSTLHHPNILQFIGVVIQPDKLCIVTEFMSEGDLSMFLRQAKVTFTPAQKLHFMLDAARGLAFLHTRSVIHRDVKAANYLVNAKHEVKISDFGLSRSTSNESMTHVGTPAWTAPEVILHEKFNESADVYSFGVVMWEILTQQEIYAGMSAIKVAMKVVDPIGPLRPPIPQRTDLPECVLELMRRCYETNPKRRPTMDEIVEGIDDLLDGPLQERRQYDVVQNPLAASWNMPGHFGSKITLLPDRTIEDNQL